MVELAHYFVSPMLAARRKSDGQTVTAYLESKTDAPFVCLACNEEVILKTGRHRVNHFAHANPITCELTTGESEIHRRCKMEIFEALQKQPCVTKAALERPLGAVRPDVSARINGVPVAIEIQFSSLSPETIAQRTREYAIKGVYVLWLLQWTPNLDARRYSPRRWEKWVHAAYFGRVYYWVEGLTVASYHFEADYKAIAKTSWYSNDGEKMTGGGYSRKSKRYRRAIRGRTMNLATDFVPRDRDWWKSNDLTIPSAKLYIDRYWHSDQTGFSA